MIDISMQTRIINNMKRFIILFIFVFYPFIVSAQDSAAVEPDSASIILLENSGDTSAFPVIALYYEKQAKYKKALHYWNLLSGDTIALKHKQLIQEILDEK